MVMVDDRFILFRLFNPDAVVPFDKTHARLGVDSNGLKYVIMARIRVRSGMQRFGIPIRLRRIVAITENLALQPKVRELMSVTCRVFTNLVYLYQDVCNISYTTNLDCIRNHATWSTARTRSKVVVRDWGRD